MVTRNAAAAPRSGAPATAKPGQNAFHTGAQARQRSEAARAAVEAESDKRAEGLDLTQINRYRFSVPEGGMKDIIVLDEDPDTLFHADEHSMYSEADRKTTFEFCPSEYDLCCLCDGIDKRHKSYTMFLTVLDLTGYTNRNTGVMVPHTKRLMAIRNNIHDEFYKLFDIAKKEFGTIRGMQLLMARDGTIRNSTGRPVMLPSGAMFEMVPEEEIIRDFGHPALEDEEHKLLKVENYDITAFQYLRIFQSPSGEALRKKYGAGSVPLGSRDDETSNASYAGVRQRMSQNPGAAPAAAAPRVRSTLAGGSGIPDPAPAAQPASAGAAIPPRTRTRSAPAAVPAAAPAATPSRTRTRPPATAATTAGPRRHAPAGTVSNDLEGEGDAF